MELLLTREKSRQGERRWKNDRTWVLRDRRRERRMPHTDAYVGGFETRGDEWAWILQWGYGEILESNRILGIRLGFGSLGSDPILSD